MKMKIIKLFMLPFAVFTLASAAAVVTDNSHLSKTTTSMTGYIHSPLPSSCEPKDVECQIGNGPVCLYDGWQVFEKENPVSCNIALERIEQ